MPEKDPTSYELITYLWVLALSCWGGIANYIRNMKSGYVTQFSLPEIVGEIVISGFTGVLTFWLCELSSFPPLLTAALVGVSGHMGSRAITLLESHFKRRMGLR